MPSISETFYEPCTDMWRQGDILINFDYGQEKINLAVLATPQCDIYWEKAEYFLFVEAGDFRASLLKIVDPGYQLDADTRDGIKELSKSKLKEIFDHILRAVSEFMSQKLD